MEMDRQTLIVIAAGALAIALFAGFYMSPQSTQSATAQVQVEERPSYSKDDIRYKYQQAEIKERKKNKGHKPPPPSTSDDTGSDDAPSNNEEPSLDHDPQEEPSND
jgi:FtsZ-interacting cell division protein ZipA